MVFKIYGSGTVVHGKLDMGHHSGRAKLVDRDGNVYEPDDVDYVIPDDEGQARNIRSGGYHIR